MAADVETAASSAATAPPARRAPHPLATMRDWVQCPSCAGTLRVDTPERIICLACGAPIALTDGIVDFVAGRFGTMLNAGHYDEAHLIDDDGARAYLEQIRLHAGPLWPTSLGTVFEIGCGTGYLSRALIASGAARKLLLTDVSADMLRACRRHLDRLGLLDRIPIGFATYSSHEACLQDEAFDTCAGGSVLHHIPDVAAMLRAVARALKPGGCAFFVEPALRFHQALTQTLADILAVSYARSPEYSVDRQKVLNWVAQTRQRLTHQGDTRFLATLEDKHFFAEEEFADLAGELGFSRAAAIPFGPDPSAEDTIRGLFAQMAISEAFTEEVLHQLPATHARYYLGLLHRHDQAPTFLLWLEKGRGSKGRRAPLPVTQPDDPKIQALAPLRDLYMRADPVPGGISIGIKGWLLAQGDVAGLAVSVGGTVQHAPVWLPRPDVHCAVNQAGLYASWNALCCGIEAELAFDGAVAAADAVEVCISAVLSSGSRLPIAPKLTLPLGQDLHLG